jgi:hypothetical protein
MKDLHGFADNNKEVLSYLPDPNEWHITDREWFCSILYSVKTVDFQKFIDEARKAQAKKHV